MGKLFSAPPANPHAVPRSTTTESLISSMCGFCGKDDAEDKCRNCDVKYCDAKCRRNDFKEGGFHIACCSPNAVLATMNIAVHFPARNPASRKTTENRPGYFRICRETRVMKELQPQFRHKDEMEMVDFCTDKSFVLCKPELIKRGMLSCYHCKKPWQASIHTCGVSEYIMKGDAVKAVLEIHHVPICKSPACREKVLAVVRGGQLSSKDSKRMETGFCDGDCWYPFAAAPCMGSSSTSDAFWISKEEEGSSSSSVMNGPVGEMAGLFMAMMAGDMDPDGSKAQELGASMTTPSEGADTSEEGDEPAAAVAVAPGRNKSESKKKKKKSKK